MEVQKEVDFQLMMQFTVFLEKRRGLWLVRRR